MKQYRPRSFRLKVFIAAFFFAVFGALVMMPRRHVATDFEAGLGLFAVGLAVALTMIAALRRR
jgi:uncharacterized paraquat-inducible protein A